MSLRFITVKTPTKITKVFPSFPVTCPVNIFKCCLFKDNGVIKSDQVFEAMLATDRVFYTKEHSYEDSPQSIGKYPHDLLFDFKVDT